MTPPVLHRHDPRSIDGSGQTSSRNRVFRPEAPYTLACSSLEIALQAYAGMSVSSDAINLHCCLTWVARPGRISRSLAQPSGPGAERPAGIVNGRPMTCFFLPARIHCCASNLLRLDDYTSCLHFWGRVLPRSCSPRRPPMPCTIDGFYAISR